MNLSQGPVPLAFGLLTCDTMEQALDRAGGKEGNKGEDCANVVLEMAQLARKLSHTAWGKKR